MAATKRSRRRRRHRRHRASATPVAGSPTFRVLVGAVAVGTQELARRIEAVTSMPRPAPAPHSRTPGRETALQKLGFLAVGVTAETLTRTGPLQRAIARRGAGAISALDAIAGLPLVRSGTRPAKAAVLRGRRAALALIARGRYETREGTSLFTLLVEDTTTRSVRDIAPFAIKEMTESRDVAALVRAQSTSVLTDTILEVRANSEQADDRIERRVRSWLRRGQPGNGKRAEPAQLPTGERKG